MKLTPELEKELLLTKEKLIDEVWHKVEGESSISHLRAAAKAQLTHTLEVLEQKGYTLVKVDKKLKDEIDMVIADNTPCYRDLFGGACEFTTGCKNCPDYFNVRHDIKDQIIALIEGEK